MSERFFLDRPLEGDRAVLTGAEARHLAAVLRAGPGDLVTLFDGSGDEILSRIESVSRDVVALSVVSRQTISREAGLELTLVVALPKGDRQQWLVEKAAEIGVARLCPLVTRRGVAEATKNALERMRRWVIEASKQCGRNRLMEIAAPRTLGQIAQEKTEEDAIRWFAHIAPGAIPLSQVLHQLNGTRTKVQIAVGPEGGFTEDEATELERFGFEKISLGKRTLRVETAAIAAASAVLLSDAADERSN